MLLTGVFGHIYRKDIRKEEYHTFLAFILIILLATIVQYFFPDYLLTGVAISLSIFMMYFTMQNPEDMLDTMTGAFNYTALLKLIKDSMESKDDFQLIAIDIQGLRRINNIFGMFVGNQIFIEVVKFLHSLKGKAWVFRKFGTRFAVITYCEEDYKRFIAMIEQRFSNPWKIMDMQIMLSAKIRHISDVSEFESAEDIVNLLDIAFVEASTNSDSPQTAAIDVGLLPEERRRIMVESAVKDSLETQAGFTLYFQPIYSVSAKKFTSAEVLLRFKHETMGKISPAEFIPVAEKLGLIFAIDQMVVEKACVFIKKNPQLFNNDFNHININLSAAEFINTELPGKLVDIVKAHGVDPQKIVFEITETVASASHNVLINCMHKMNAEGFRFALDDFGTGHANIIQVVNLPFYSVKLDRELLDSGFRKNDSMVIFEDTLNMFKRLGLKTVAEGVMTEEQAVYITSLKADYIQGFYYAMPMPEQDLIALLRDQTGA
jgi:EAL domain-containing protein (putative c-di-GMP-specific phosphodiesterase class I)